MPMNSDARQLKATKSNWLRRIVPLQLAVLSIGALPLNLFADLAQPIPVRLVAKQQATSPGTSLAFDGFYPPSVDAQGNALVFGTLSGSPDERRGVWIERGASTLAKIAVTGDVQPASQSSFYFAPSFDGSHAYASGGGNVAFSSAFMDSNGVGVGGGVWLAAPTGAPQLIAAKASVPGIVAPVLPNFAQFTEANDAGELVFAELRNSIYAASVADGARLVAKTNTVAPGAAGAKFTEVFNPQLNEHGQIGWQGQVEAPIRTGRGIWKEDALGNAVLVAREGQAAPGIPTGGFFFFDSFDLDDNGRIAFAAQTYSPTATADSGVWAEREGSGLTPLFLEGELAPGAGDGVRFSDLDRITMQVAYGSSGDVALKSRLAGPGIDAFNDSGLWIAANDGAKRLIAREGAAAPGVEPGVTFGSFATTSPVLVNARGQVAFFAFLEGPGIGNGNDRGIWAETADGVLTLIARTGAQYTDSDGSTFTLDTLTMGDRAFGANGHLAFSSRFAADRLEGVFVSSVVAVPEPAGQCLLAIAVAATVVVFRASGMPSPEASACWSNC